MTPAPKRRVDWGVLMTDMDVRSRAWPARGRKRRIAIVSDTSSRRSNRLEFAVVRYLPGPGSCRVGRRDEKFAPQETLLYSCDLRPPPRQPLGELGGADQRLQCVSPLLVSAKLAAA